MTLRTTGPPMPISRRARGSCIPFSLAMRNQRQVARIHFLQPPSTMQCFANLAISGGNRPNWHKLAIDMLRKRNIGLFLPKTHVLSAICKQFSRNRRNSGKIFTINAWQIRHFVVILTLKAQNKKVHRLIRLYNGNWILRMIWPQSKTPTDTKRIKSMKIRSENIARLAIMAILWLSLVAYIILNATLNFFTLFAIIASGIIVFVPMWRKYGPEK